MEIIHLANVNDQLDREMKKEFKLKGDTDQSRQYLEMRIERYEREL